jgi:hypothetical protein
MEKTKNIIPSYIPAEFLLHHPWKYVIGIVSTSLINASKLTNAKVISIIDLFKWTDDATHEKEILRDEIKNHDISIPKDINELKSLLKTK